MAEAIEGMLAGDGVWGQLAEYCGRLLMCAYEPDVDKPQELKARSRFWQRG